MDILWNMVILIYLLLGTASFAGILLDHPAITAADANDVFQSVEIGLAELSPRGEVGGLAVPASGEAPVHGITVSQACNSATTVQATVTTSGEGGTLTIDGVSYGEIADGGSKSVTVSHSATHNGLLAVPAVCVLRMGGHCEEWSGGDNYDFTFTSPSCTPAPSVSCSVSPTSIQTGQGVTWTANPSGGNGSYTYQWSGTDSLSGSARTVNKSYSTAGTKTASVRVTSAGMSSAWVSCSNSVTVTQPPSPTATLRVRNTTDGTGWTTGNITIDPIDQIALNWSSTNANTCSGSNFSTGSGSPTSGTQSSVSEPARNTSRTYSVVCNGDGGSASDALSVTTSAGSDVTLDVDPTYVHVGDETELEWNLGTNVPATCTLVGPGVNMTTMSSGTGSTDVQIYGESTYVLTCPGGNDEATVEVLPVVQET